MIDLEKERETFNEQFGVPEPHECFLAKANPAQDSFALKCNWLGWKACAESKQAEIDSLKAYRSDFEIIQQTIALVDLLATSTNVYQRDPSCLYPFESENPRVKEWWRTACKIQELLTNTDPENCDFDEYKKMIEAAQENSHE